MPPRQHISVENKKKIVKLYLDQYRMTDIANIMDLNIQTVSRIVQKYLKDGEVQDNSHKKGGPHTKKLNEEQLQIVKNWVDEDCSLSLKTITEKCLAEFGVRICISTARNYLTGFNYTLKRIKLLPERRNTPQTIEVRKQYALRFIEWQAEMNDSNFMFLDEVGFNVSMRSKRGWSASGKPATQVVPSIRSRNITICCTISRNGIVTYEYADGAFNQHLFLNYLDKLKQDFATHNISEPIIIMDNVAFHKTGIIKTFAEENNIRLEYLPPYSPFLNPIENMFSKWKEIVGRAKPQNETELMQAIKDGANLITKEDCDGYYRNMLRYVRKCCNGEEIID